MATVTVSPTSPTATKDACNITVAGGSRNVSTAPDPNVYPAQAEVRYYLTFEKGGVEKGRSYVFGVDHDGGFVFPGYIFPEAGTFVVRLKNSADNSTVASSSNVTVQ